MSGARRLRILTELAEASDRGATAGRLCEVCMKVTSMTGAGIMLMSGELPLGSACSTGEVSALIEDLQYTLGQGPCVDAYKLDRPVLEPDLADPEIPRWPAFAGPAVTAGVRAVFGFPIGVGAVRLGALNLYSDRPGRLTDDQHADALVMAEVAAEAVLAMHAGGPDGVVPAALENGSNPQYVVHQAAGMVSVQLGVSVAHALVRLRAYAFAHGRMLADVAADVVARELRFDQEDT
jgi:GAF domain-containing protein